MKQFFRFAAVAFLVILTGSLSVTLDAMNWPSESAVLLRNFGSNDRGKPVLGMIFSGETEILAAERGEIIFSRDRNDIASRLPSPLGAWTAVDHGDGLISIYSRYADEAQTEETPSLTRVEKSQLIASSGTSGWSSRTGFNFIIFDRRERRWINPAMLVTPVRSTRSPQIISVDLLNAQGTSTQMRNLTQGNYTVVVNTVSPAVQGSILAPHRIICLVNGAEAGMLNFEAFSARDGILMAFRNRLVPVRQVYESFPAFRTAEIFLSRGQATLEIIVQDMEGNSSSSITRLIVN